MSITVIFTLTPLNVSIVVYKNAKGTLSNGRRGDRKVEYGRLSNIVDLLLKKYCTSQEKRNAYLQFCADKGISLSVIDNPFLLPIPLFSSEIISSGLLVETIHGEL